MVDAERENEGASLVCMESNGGEAMNNGIVLETEAMVSADANSARLSGKALRTYKRQKRQRMGASEPELVGCEKLSMGASARLTDKIEKQSGSCDQVCYPRIESQSFILSPDVCKLNHRRNKVLKQIHHSLRDCEGGLNECIRYAFSFGSENSCEVPAKESNHVLEHMKTCSTQSGNMLHGIRNLANGQVGWLNEPNPPTKTQLCQRVFFDVMISEKFSQLCNLLFENFRGIEVDSFLDVNLMNRRMIEGSYESSPMLFHSDIQQMWNKLEKVGTELNTLAKSLSEKSSASYREQLGGTFLRTSEDGKDQLATRIHNLHAKTDNREACCVRKACTCSKCGDKAEGRDYLVCDSCEGMYHVSCIEPAVEEIPLRSWYCVNCTAKGIGSPHENCLVCERLNAPVTGIGIDMSNDTPLASGKESNGLVEDGNQFGCETSQPYCKICGNEVENTDDYRVCGHSFCQEKYFHVRCLTSKQLNTYGRCWYCPSCLCRSCLTDKDDDKIVLCDGCDHAYHIYCMQPPRFSIPRGKWFCRKCDADIQKIQQVKQAYFDNIQNKLKMRSEGHVTFDNLKSRRRIGTEEKSGGVDMLLTAAKTLKYEESLAAIGMKE